MTKQTWIIATALSIAVVFSFLALSSWRQSQELSRVLNQLGETQQTADETLARLNSLREELTRAEQEKESLRLEKEKVAEAHSAMEKQMREALESRDITISELQGKLTVNILDRILFDSGEAVLKPQGEKVLEQIATVLAQYPNRQIHVIGHTDNVPIRAGARSRFASNWELSTARATAAVRFLSEKAGVDSRRLGAVGYGEFHPLAENNTAEGRAKNRRIALVVLSEEMQASDVLPGVKTNSIPADSIRSEPVKEEK